MSKDYKPGSKEHALALAQVDLVKQIATLLKCNTSDVVERTKALVHENKRLKDEIEAVGKDSSPASAVKTVGGVDVLTYTIEGLSPKDLRSLVDDGKKQIGSGVVVVIGKLTNGKASLIVGVSDDLTDTITAVELVKAGVETLGGKGGGGRPDMAQGGGPDSDKANDAVEAIEAVIAELQGR